MVAADPYWGAGEKRLVSGQLAAGKPALLVHGGAWAIPPAERAAHLDGLSQAIAAGRAVLEAGGPALDAVVAAVAAMEAHGAFDAGRGGVLHRDGQPRLDAGLMDGASGRWGAVAQTGRLVAPVRVARRLSESDGQARLLVGAGAEAFAEETGFDLVETHTLVHPREVERFHALRAAEGFHTSRAFSGLPPSADLAPQGTVGCVALDADGHLAAATSTGGTPLAPVGRVGDTPLPGCGFFASEAAAASATGWGEAIAARLLCGRAVDAVASGAHPVSAARAGLSDLFDRVPNPRGEGGTGGLIVLGADGLGGWAFTTPRMARGGWTLGAAPWRAL